MLAYYLLVTLLNSVALHLCRYETPSTTGSTAVSLSDSYSEAEDQSQRSTVPLGAGATSGNVAIAVDTTNGSRTHDGPQFIPAYLAVRDLQYFVPHRAEHGEQLQLLQGVTAYFKPGAMTVLMSSGGAVKTRFMDVLAGRKTGGTIKGEKDAGERRSE